VIGADHIGSKTSESVERTAAYGFTKPTWQSPSLHWRIVSILAALSRPAVDGNGSSALVEIAMTCESVFGVIALKYRPEKHLEKTSGIPLSMARSGLRWLAAECATSDRSESPRKVCRP
jgi:hypothetical protein